MGSLDRRKAKRVKHPLRILVQCDHSTFRSMAHDISMSGVRLEHAIPRTMLGQKLLMYVMDPHRTARIRLHVEIVDDQTNPLRFIFNNMSDIETAKLQTWLTYLEAKEAKAA